MSNARFSDAVIRDAYLYVLSRCLVVRQEHIDLRAEGFAYNTLTHHSHQTKDFTFVNPNLDVTYAEAWIAVDDENPVILSIPPVEGRYFTAQVMNEWGEVLVNINERATPEVASGLFAFCKAGSSPELPEGAYRIDLHSAKAKFLTRVELQNTPDIATEYQHRVTLTAPTQVSIQPPPPLPDFGNAELIGIEAFELADSVLSSALDVSPAAVRWQLAARAIASAIKTDPQEHARVKTLLREEIIPWFQKWARTEAAPYVNHWIGGTQAGHYGSDIALRAAVNYLGIWANTAEEVVYFLAAADSEAQPLNGSHHFQLHFSADQLPSDAVDGYWSVTLMSVPEYKVIPNDLKRYHLNQYSPLTYGEDGSLTFDFAPELPVGAAATNWIPTQKDTPFTLTFRCYVPSTARPFGEWSPPAVSRVR